MKPEKIVPVLVLFAAAFGLGAWFSAHNPSVSGWFKFHIPGITAESVLTQEEEIKSSAYASFIAGVWHENAGRSEDAIRFFEKSKELDPTSARTRIHLGVNLMNAGYHREASLEFDRVADLFGSSAEARRIGALLFVSQGRYSDAITQYKIILESQPDDIKTVEALADLCVLKNDLLEAEQYFKYLTELNPQSDLAFFNLGIVRSKIGHYPEAERDMMRAIQLKDSSTRYWYALTLIRETRGNKAGVKEALARIEALGPEGTVDYLQLARLYASVGEVESALRQYGTALELDSKNAELLKDALLFCMQHKYYEEARDWSAEADKNGLADAKILFTHAYALEALGQTEEALIAYQAVLEEDPDFADAYFYLGVLYDRRGDKLLARQQLRRAITLDPGAAEAYNYLGYMNVEEGLQLNEAILLIEKAIQIDPSNAAFADSLGWAYYKKGLYDQAVSELERAVQLDGADRLIQLHLLDAYEKAGHQSRAEELKAGWVAGTPVSDAGVASKH